MKLFKTLPRGGRVVADVCDGVRSPVEAIMRQVLALALTLCAAASGCGDTADHTPQPPPPPPGGSLLWGGRFGRSPYPLTLVAAADGHGNVVVGGRFFATADFGGGPITSPSNNWQAFVAKYDGNGKFLWMHSFGDIYEETVGAVACDGDGNVYLAGEFRGTIDFGGGPIESAPNGGDLFVAKLAPDGSHLWSRRFGAFGADRFTHMAINARGDLAFSGHVADGADFGSGPITLVNQPFIAMLDPSGTTTYVTAMPASINPSVGGDADHFVVDEEGSLIGATDHPQKDAPDGLVLFQFRPTGTLAWKRTLASSMSDLLVRALSLAADGTIYVTGSIFDSADFGGITTPGVRGDAFVFASGPDGAPKWVHRLHSPADTTAGRHYESWVWPNGITAVADGVVLTGSFYGDVDLGSGLRQSVDTENVEGCCSQTSDVFALRLDLSGAWMWETILGGKGEQVGTAISTDPAGNVFVAGWAGGSLPFGDNLWASATEYDGFLAKLAP
jgi:outer membrane protein assembly factor BamB